MSKAALLGRLVSAGQQLDDGQVTLNEIPGVLGAFDPTAIFTITNTSDSTSPITGAIQVTGGIGIGKKLYAHTGINVGTATGGIGQSQITNRSALVYPNGAYVLKLDNPDATSVYALQLTNSTNSGAVWLKGNEFILTSGGSEVLLASPSVVSVKQTTAATSTTTGALVVGGGLGVAGALYAGSIQNTPIGSTTANTGAFTTLTSSSTTESTSSTSGAVIIAGGVGIAKKLYVGGTLNVGGTFSGALGSFTNLSTSDTTDSSSTSTGTITTAGGVGIAKNLYVGAQLNVAGNVTVSGNLTVSGTTTTINTTNLNIADNIITLNSDFTVGTPSENAGIEVLRGISPSVSIRWNEDTDVWQFTNDGTNFYTLPTSDINTTYSISSETTTDGVHLRLTGSDSTTDNLKFANGTGITLTRTDANTITVTNGGVTGITGTINQITASASTGSVTLSLPQNIATGSNLQFNSLGIGTPASGNSGEIRTTGDITAFYSASDIRVKENISSVSGVLDKLSELNLYSFNYINKPDRKMLGLMAQELVKDFPELVYETAPLTEISGLDKIYAINYSLVSAILVQAINELNQKLNRLLED
jgi:hypothetical protein